MAFLDTRRLIGLVIALVGLLILTGFIPMTTVVYAGEEKILSPVPAGDQAMPTVYMPGTEQLISLRVMTYDSASGISLPNVATILLWKVTVNITPNNQFIDMGRYVRREYVGDPSKPITEWYIWQARWVVPNTPDTLYKFSWKVEIKDSGGLITNTLTTTSYVKVSSVDPDGYFELNGQKVNTESTIFVTSPTLSLKFSPIAGATNIKEIRADIYKGTNKVTTVVLTQQEDGTYIGTANLPDYGAYKINGYIVTKQDKAYLKMTTVVGTDPNGDGGIEPPSEVPLTGFNEQQLAKILISGGLIGLGMLIFFTRRSRY